MIPEFQVRSIRKPGWHWADNVVLDRYIQLIGAYGYTVYMYLARHSDNGNGSFTRNQADISRGLGLSVDTIQRSLAKLIDCGLIKCVMRLGKPNVYVLLHIPDAELSTKSTKSTDLPLTAAGNLPPIAAGVPPTAVGRPLLAVCDKEEDSLQDSSQDKPSPLVDPAVDIRFSGFRKQLEKRHSEANEIPTELIWDGRCAAALRSLLKTRRTLTIEQFDRCLLNYYQSYINPSDHPAVFMRNPMKFWAGSIDQFGKLEKYNPVKQLANIGRA